MDEAEYPGIRVIMSTTFDGVVTPLKIDISTGDAITPRAVSYTHLDVYKRQKRDRPLDIVPEWTQTGQTEDGFAINRYFIDHPEMVLGRQEPVSTAQMCIRDSASSMKELDGGQLDMPELSCMKAVLQICDDNDLSS